MRKTTLRHRQLAPGAAFVLALSFAAGWTLAAQEPEAPAAPGSAEAGAETEAAAPVSSAAGDEVQPAPRVVLIRIDSAIHPVAAEYIVDSLAEADEMRAEALVIELNTPGGLLTSTREITKAMLSARTPVVVYVSPSGAQAASAGFFLVMAADVAAMAPGTNTGAAHPVGGQGEDIEGHMGKKVEEDAAATIRSLARQHGRDVELAEQAVLESRSFTAEEALEAGLIDVVAPRLEDLLEQIDGREVEKVGEEAVTLKTAEATVVELEMPVLRRFLSAIARPEIATILMALGLLGLYMELSNPGVILPGVVGAICMILGLYALSVLPINYAGVALVLLALVLFVAETQVPTFGLLTLGGAISLILGVVMLFKDVGPPMRAATGLIAGTVVTVLIIVVLLTTRSVQVRRTKVVTGREGLVGEQGMARTDIAPRGKVFVHGEIWTAVAEVAVAAGSPVEVAAVEGMTLRVRAQGVGEPAAAAGGGTKSS